MRARVCVLWLWMGSGQRFASVRPCTLVTIGCSRCELETLKPRLTPAKKFQYLKAANSVLTNLVPVQGALCIQVCQTGTHSVLYCQMVLPWRGVLCFLLSACAELRLCVKGHSPPSRRLPVQICKYVGPCAGRSSHAMDEQYDNMRGECWAC